MKINEKIPPYVVISRIERTYKGFIMPSHIQEELFKNVYELFNQEEQQTKRYFKELQAYKDKEDKIKEYCEKEWKKLKPECAYRDEKRKLLEPLIEMLGIEKTNEHIQGNAFDFNIEESDENDDN